MSEYLLFAVAFGFGFFSGAALVIVLTYVREPCNHQWNTIQEGQLNRFREDRSKYPIGLFWIDECTVCRKTRMRKETA